MYRNLVFYNWYGNGDLFNSREFVKELMKKIPAENYIYCHSKSERMFEDMPKLESRKMMSWCDNSKPFVRVNDDLAINTWIGRTGNYVLPGIGCTIHQNIRMYNDTLRLAGLDLRLAKDGLDYIPEIDFLKLNHKYLDNITNFIKERAGPRVLWANGPAQSAQSDNFDFGPTILKTATKYPYTTFIVTEPMIDCRHNIFWTGDIIQAKDSFDLNEIAYLSLFCRTFIGRPTGPFVFAQVKENMRKEAKALLGFSYHPNVLTFALKYKTPIGKYWSNATQTDDVSRAVREVLDR